MGPLDVYQIFLERTGRASMVITSDRDTAEWLAMFDDVLLAQSAVDRLKNSAFDFVIEGESYRARLKPKVDLSMPPPAAPAMKRRSSARAFASSPLNKHPAGRRSSSRRHRLAR